MKVVSNMQKLAASTHLHGRISGGRYDGKHFNHR